MMLGKLFKQSSSDRMKMITEGNIFKTFMFLSIPGILMIFIQAAMPIIDGIFIYNFDDSFSGGAISYCSNLQNIFIMGANGISIAGAALIGQTNGTGDVERAKIYASKLMSLTFITGLICSPLFLIVTMLFSSNMDPLMKDKILTYAFILALTLPFMVLQVSFNSIKNVFGHPEVAFIRTLLFVPIKLLCTFTFVGFLRLGIVGAALSVFLSYFLVFLFMVYDMFIAKSDSRLSFKELKPDFTVFGKYFSLGWPAAVQNATKSLGFFLVKLDVSKYGPVALSAQPLAGDVNNMFMNFTSCYDSAIISFVSINVGAGNGERAKKAAYLAVKLGVISSIIFAVLSAVIGPHIIRLYTDDAAILDIALRGNLILTWGFLGFAVLFNEMPAFMALGLNKVSLLIQTLRIWVVRFVALYTLYFFFEDIGVNAAFISLSIANTVGAIISHILFTRVKWVKRV